VLGATLLALGAAILHASWNIATKQSGDRWLALWAQMTIAGVLCSIFIVASGGVPHEAWLWASLSGITHVGYVWFLARAYDLGDFSVTYPIARGNGAVLAALGGVVFLNDHLSIVNVLGIAIAAGGLFLLAGPADNKHVLAALCVSLTIGIYSTVDSHGSRVTGGNLYPLTIFTTGAFFISLHGLAMGRAQEMNRTLRTLWKPLTVTACASVLTYWMVLLAVQRASVGYVTAIRESSVVLAALFGWKVLKEGNARRRITAAGVVLLGLVILVAS